MKLLRIVLLTVCVFSLPAANTFCAQIRMRSYESLAKSAIGEIGDLARGVVKAGSVDPNDTWVYKKLADMCQLIFHLRGVDKLDRANYNLGDAVSDTDFSLHRLRGYLDSAAWKTADTAPFRDFVLSALDEWKRMCLLEDGAK